MEFSLSAEQCELKEAAVAFARAKLDQDLAKREEAGEFSAEAWLACARFGVQGLPVPAELGGGGADIVTTAWLAQQGKPAVAAAAAAKLFTSEAFVASSLDAVQIHGAYGSMKEAGIERDLRDAVAGTIYSGTSEIQRVILARMLGL